MSDLSIDMITKRLKLLGEITGDDYYVSFHNDGSSVIKIIGLDKYFVHSFDNDDLLRNLNNLIVRTRAVLKKCTQ
ncbi:MAG: hypothetical protein PF569_01945 [Candidatus Woesearchaeota archaeon]|jgi:hypothetical protein|nr:hypothetical protein [Candidatus Woesearchaeota archaeon]